VNEYAQSRISHPAALRLKLFDYVRAERIIYFDADWLCIRDWKPSFPERSCDLLACRDFILTEEWPRQQYDFQSDSFLGSPADVPLDAGPDILRQDYIREIQAFADLRLPCSRWINSGLLLMNRTHHKALLETALELYSGGIGHHPEYFEQPALMKAIELLETSVRLLPRNLNVLAAYETKWPSSIVGLHVKLKRHGTFLGQIRQGLVSSPEQVQLYFQKQ